MFCPSCGLRAAAGATFCTACGARLAAARPFPAGDAEVPDSVRGWSWGAFLLPPLWGIGNRTWVGLLALIPYINIAVALWLGIKGREMAWRNKPWDSLEHFERVQRTWSRAAAGIVGAMLLGLAAALAVPAYQSYVQKARATDAYWPQANAVGAFASAAVAVPEISDSGVIDADATLPAAMMTSAGMLKLAQDGPAHAVLLNGRPLFRGEDAPWHKPLRSFTLASGREAILMASRGGRANGCDTRFFFLVIDARTVRSTPMFGTCSPRGKFIQNGDIVALELPTPHGIATYELRNGKVLEDGRALRLDDTNDPAR